MSATKIPKTLKYTKDHEWLHREAGNLATIGITDHAQAQLGDVTLVEAPAVGDIITAGRPCGTVESVKAASDSFAPVSGEVVEVNEVLKDQPELLNASPYEKGWVFKVQLSQPEEVNGLLDSAAYEAHVLAGGE